MVQGNCHQLSTDQREVKGLQKLWQDKAFLFVSHLHPSHLPQWKKFIYLKKPQLQTSKKSLLSHQYALN